jgi:hypothetical protein
MWTSLRPLLLLALLLPALACSRGELLPAPDPAPPLAVLDATLTQTWDLAWLGRLEAAAPALLADRYPAAHATLGGLVLSSAGGQSYEVAGHAWALPAADLRLIDAVGQAVGVQIDYGAASASVHVTAAAGVCELDARVEALTLHQTFRLVNAGGVGALDLVGPASLIGASRPVSLDAEGCALELPTEVLAELEAQLGHALLGALAAEQETFARALLVEVFQPTGFLGIRYRGLGGDDAYVDVQLLLDEGSHVWRRDLSLALGGAPVACAGADALRPRLSLLPGVAPAEACLRRLSVPNQALVDVLEGLGALGLSCQERLNDATLSEAPAFLGVAPNLDLRGPYRVAFGLERLEALEVGPGAGGEGVTFGMDGAFVLRVYARVEGSPGLLGEALLEGRLTLGLRAAGGRLRFERLERSGALSERVPLVPLEDAWFDAALDEWLRVAAEPELDLLTALMSLTTAPGEALVVRALTATGEALEVCIGDDGEGGP